MSPTSRPRRTRRGPARGCPPRWNGRRPAPGTRRPTPGAATRGERRSPSSDLANLGGTALRPAPVGAYPAGASAYGVEQMLGDVWEWTTSPLRPWPGFVPMIYERYSQPFFDGDYRVLRGGSWAVESAILRPSFRNWDHPYPSPDLLRCPAGLGRPRRWRLRLMCRHLGWLGADVSVSSLMLDPPSGLAVQSYAPRRQKHGLMNADGWGVGFFDRRRAAALAQRGAAVGRRVVRIGGARAAQPLRGGRGALGDRRHADRSQRDGAVHRRALAAVAQRRRRPRRAAADVVGRICLRQCDAGGHHLRAGLDALGDTIARSAPLDPAARLNILAANGSRLLATAWGDTLSILRRDDGVVLASEPYDDDSAMGGRAGPPPRRSHRERCHVDRAGLDRKDLDDAVAVQPSRRRLGVPRVAP